jgi:hypothetical protein
VGFWCSLLDSFGFTHSGFWGHPTEEVTMSPLPPVILPVDYEQVRTKVRRRPAMWLRRRERRIVGRRPRPSATELTELGAIRRELRIRAHRPAPLRWWLAA